LILAELIKDWPCEVQGGSIREEISGITDVAEQIQPGNIFVARKGKLHNGWNFVSEAVAKGAVAIVYDQDQPIEHLEVPHVWVPDCSTFLSYACKAIVGDKIELLTIIGVTGTNGKTTVTHFIGQILQKLGAKVAVLGTLGLWINGERQDQNTSSMTTPPPTYLYPIFAQCVELGVKYIIIEASSLGLSQHRLDHCPFNYGVYLNMSRDHYDEHGSKEKYELAKRKLATLANKIIVNADDPFCLNMKQHHVRSFTFGRHRSADISVIHKEIEGTSTVLLVQYLENPVELTMPFVGEHHQQNVLAAVATVQQLGYPLQIIAPSIPYLKLPSGRQQEVENDLGIRIVIDYAHTPSALVAVLQSLKLVSKKKLIVVFGCGGDRDHGKRREMGKVADSYAHKIWLTSDNPRREQADMIIAQIAQGIDLTPYAIKINRKQAIESAIAEAIPGDTVLIAGKGHETTQIIGNEVVPFSDYEIAKEYIKLLKTRLNDEK